MKAQIVATGMASQHLERRVDGQPVTLSENTLGLLDDHTAVQGGLELRDAVLQFGAALDQRGWQRFEVGRMPIVGARIHHSVDEARIAVADVGWYRLARNGAVVLRLGRAGLAHDPSVPASTTGYNSSHD